MATIPIHLFIDTILSQGATDLGISKSDEKTRRFRGANGKIMLVSLHTEDISDKIALGVLIRGGMEFCHSGLFPQGTIVEPELQPFEGLPELPFPPGTLED